MWQNAAAVCGEHLFWGTGFASLTNLHNVYLQLFFELGIVGSLLLVGSLALATLEGYARYKRAPRDPFLAKVRVVGLIHVLSFALSNHNLNHHLTWFVCFLCLALAAPKREVVKGV